MKYVYDCVSIFAYLYRFIYFLFITSNFDNVDTLDNNTDMFAENSPNQDFDQVEKGAKTHMDLVQS